MQMEIDIRKKYSMSKKNIYGIDNEDAIIKQIQTRLQEVILLRAKQKAEKIQQFSSFKSSFMDEYIEDELDEKTAISLIITSNLKEITMK